MADYIIENEDLKAVVSQTGCELVSVVRKTDGREYLWQGDPDVWKRHAPLLFPLVGRYRNDTVRHNGKAYHMPQHGFARDLAFELIEHSVTEVSMRLKSTSQTREVYPFAFELICSHRLCGSGIRTKWRVENPDTETMYFSIGGHPAFVCNKRVAPAAGCTLFVHCDQPVLYCRRLNENGLVTDFEDELVLDKSGRISVTEDFFDRDVYIIEQNQSHCIELEQEGKPFVTVRSAAPVFGLWAPPHKSVPFVCIEPWYGRSDSAGFTGELKDRAWGNALKAGGVFEAGYEILFH